MKRAVVFAYHDVGVRCLATLLAHDVEVELVVTHDDNPAETIWFASVAELARSQDLALIRPQRADDPQLLARLQALAPDFIFSFYYRHMLGPALLASARRGALNMHGSLLPQYRGRVPVNWAILHGERTTGASLHYMAARPDAGDLVDQMAVPILPDDDALAVFRKVTCAAELVLDRSLPALLAGTAARRPLNLAAGSYFGGRSAADGRIDWQHSAQDVHNLVRAVAPPYPGAFTSLQQHDVRILQTRTLRTDAAATTAALAAVAACAPDAAEAPTAGDILCAGELLLVRCGDSALQWLRVLRAECDGKPLNAALMAELAAGGALRFT